MGDVGDDNPAASRCKRVEEKEQRAAHQREREKARQERKRERDREAQLKDRIERVRGHEPLGHLLTGRSADDARVAKEAIQYQDAHETIKEARAKEQAQDLAMKRIQGKGAVYASV